MIKKYDTKTNWTKKPKSKTYKVFKILFYISSSLGFFTVLYLTILYSLLW